jgi:integrase
MSKPAKRKSTRRPKGQGSYWTDGKRHFFRFRGRTVADRDKDTAAGKLEILKRQLDREIKVDDGKQAFGLYLGRYIDNEVTKHVKASTVFNYKKHAEIYVIPFIGKFRISDLKRRDGVSWVNTLLDRVGANGKLWALSSISSSFALVDRALDNAVAEDLIEHNPFKGIKVPTRRKGDEMDIDGEEDAAAKAFTLEQVAILLEEVRRTDMQFSSETNRRGVRGLGMYVLYILAIELGLRRGELIGLRWRDIDFEEYTIHIKQQVISLDGDVRITKPKTDSSARDVPFTGRHAAMLKDHKAFLGKLGEQFVFPNEEGGHRRPNAVTFHFNRVMARLGWEGYSFHSMRHTAITLWRTDGVPLEVAAALAGHKGVKVTAEIYSEATIDRKRTAINRREGK